VVEDDFECVVDVVVEDEYDGVVECWVV